MKTNVICFAIGLLGILLSSGVLPAQTVGLELDSAMVDSNAAFDIRLRASHFTNVTSAQFSVRWNPAVIAFSSLEKLSASLNLAPTNFNTNETPQGRLGFLWTDLSGMGTTLRDSSLLFELRFRAVGRRGDTTTVRIAGEPVPVSIESFNSVLNCAPKNGLILIEQTDAVRTLDLSAALRVGPVPAADRITIIGSGIPPGTWRIRLLDLQGKVVREQSFSFTSNPSLDLDVSSFNPGTYFIHGVNGVYRFLKKTEIIR